MTDINKPVNLNEMIKSIIMRIKLIRCIELKAIVTLSLVLINSGNLLIGSNLFIRDNNDLSADTILRYNHYPTGKLYVYYSKDQTNQSSPAVIFFFCGGWNSGSPKQFESQASYLNKYGVTVVLADYRTQKNAGTTPKEALMDAKSAMRYLKQHAMSIHVDPDKILAGGGSAGGHLAAATAFCHQINNPEDDLNVSSIPKALILFNPVIDNGPHGYGFDRVKDYYRDFSPIHNIKKDAPPAIFFLGSEDNIVLLETALKFKKKMEHVGSRCDLLLYPGQKHGFFNAKFEEFFEKTMSATVVFLKSLGYIK